MKPPLRSVIPPVRGDRDIIVRAHAINHKLRRRVDR